VSTTGPEYGSTPPSECRYWISALAIARFHAGSAFATSNICPVRRFTDLLPWGAGTPSISSSYTAASNHFQVGRGAPRVGAPRVVGSERRFVREPELLRCLPSGPRRLLGLALGLTAPLALLRRLLGLSAPRVALLGLLALLLRVAGNVALRRLLIAALPVVSRRRSVPRDLVRLRRGVLE